ncbi:MAG: glycosyltransferase family 4 protein [Dehalococcoidales bacterium]|jgi:hypothetical protein
MKIKFYIKFAYHYFYDNIYTRLVSNFYLLKWKIYKYKLFNKCDKPTILYISFINGGGLLKHINELITGMKDTYDVWVFTNDNFVTHYDGNKKIIFKHDLDLNSAIRCVNPDIIHVHQLSKTLWEIPFIEWEKSIITIHDMYYVCPYFFMTECMNDKFCHPSLCNIEWRNEMHGILVRCKSIICPSVAMKDLLLFYYPDIENKITIIEHGINKLC